MQPWGAPFDGSIGECRLNAAIDLYVTVPSEKAGSFGTNPGQTATHHCDERRPALDPRQLLSAFDDCHTMTYDVQVYHAEFRWNVAYIPIALAYAS